jgi:hypothetical protein
MFETATKRGPDHTSVIVLWNGEWGGPGGPSDVVERSTERGIRVVVLDTRQLFGLEGTPPPSDSPS